MMGTWRRTGWMYLSLLLVVGLALPTADASPGRAPADQLWVSRYDSADHRVDRAVDVALSPDGTVAYVTGTRGEDDAAQIATIAYQTSNGARLWLRRYGAADAEDQAEAVAVSPSGLRIYVTGAVWVRRSWRFVTIAYAAGTGDRVWVAKSPRGAGADVDVALDGSTVVVAGSGRGPDGVYDEDLIIQGYSASTGTKAWVARYGPDRYGTFAHDLEVAPNGATAFVSGLRSFSNRYVTLAVNTRSGMRRWVNTYRFGGAIANRLAVDLDGDLVFMAGQRWNGEDYDFITVASDLRTGRSVWRRVYANGGAGAMDDDARSIAVAPDGTKLFVTGESWSSESGYGFATVAYRARDGGRLWVRRSTGPAFDDDVPSAVAVAPDSSTVFVTGASPYIGTDSTQFLTIAYAATGGATAWKARYDGPGSGDDQPAAIVASPDGSMVVITGYSHGGATSDDYATVAYATA